MFKFTFLIAIVFLLSCKTTSYYIVRHAEKEASTPNMSSDVPLSAQGRQRAEALKETLQNKKVTKIYSTNYLRTKGTAQPLAEANRISIEVYDPRDTGFISRVRNANTGNILIVGHSNTVDDLVNQLMGEKKIAGDLNDAAYGDLFIVKKKGKKYSFEQRHFGE